MNNKNTVDVIVISEQLETIDVIERSLKSSLVINHFQSNQATEIKKILSHEKIDLVLVDDAEGSLGVGSVRSAITELRMEVPILQLVSADQEKPAGTFIKNGATAVCVKTDEVAILQQTKLLIEHYNSTSATKEDEALIEDYRQKFEELYDSLADPICFLQDGLFMDCNPAFLHAFELSDKSDLDEMTIMNFVERKSQAEMKKHLQKSSRRDMSATPVTFPMVTKLGNDAEYNIMSKPSKYNEHDAIQVYMRSTAEGGAGGASLYDETTGLANREQMGFYLKQKIEHFGKEGGHATLAYVMIKNYRDLWGSDGFHEAEKFIKATANYVRTQMPAHTEVSRYTDDGILMYLPEADLKKSHDIFTDLIKGLDKVTPEGMERMIEPICYVGFDTIDKDSDYHTLISQAFRAARNAALSDGPRVNRPTTTEVAEKDSKRLDTLQAVLQRGSLRLSYQPIASFDPDNTERYRERVALLDEEGKKLELDVMFSVAERYQIAHRIDKWKINYIFDKLLEADMEERQTVLIFISISADSLKNPGFVQWLVEQMQHTGLGGKYFVFEMMTDHVQNAYTGALRFANAMREQNAHIAISKIGGLSKDNERILDDLKPDFIKLDLREIDTLDESEEAEVMGDIKHKADSINATMIAEYLESPAQLSRIWPYDVKFIQGDGMTPLLDDMDFNFDEFAIS